MIRPACRGCGSAELEVVIDFGPMPLANALVKAQDLDLPERRYPLALAFCPVCFLAQILEAVPPDLMFRDYPYFSSNSDAMVSHARQLVDKTSERMKLGPTSLAVEVASNDGYLLQHYVARGVPVLGIDPATEIAAEATARGVPTIPEFFGLNLAESLRADGRMADVVHANNVLAHVPDIHGFLAGLARILKPGGMVIVETPYVRDLVDQLEFDTIYHEHVFYYSLSSIAGLIRQHHLEIVDVERIPIHGGSLRVTIAHAGARSIEPLVSTLLAEEAAVGLTSVDYFRGFADRVQALGDDLRARLAALHDGGATIAAYGAAAKGAVLLNAFAIGRDTISFVADRSPHKVGCFMPGVRIPIRSAEYLSEARPDVCLLLAWNFADEILEQQSGYRAAGGRFLIPIPAPRLI
jgi:SAM-dependent methyltransferase